MKRYPLYHELNMASMPSTKMMSRKIKLILNFFDIPSYTFINPKKEKDYVYFGGGVKMSSVAE